MGDEAPSEMLKGGPQHWGFGPRAAVQRANLGLAVTEKQRFKPESDHYSGFLKFRKLPERAKNAASFGHSNAENLSASDGFTP